MNVMDPAAVTVPAAIRLRVVGVGKSFPGVRALDEVSLDVRQGEIHALVGENGAGKSTLMKILSGIYPAGTFDGSFSMDGVACLFRSVQDASRAGFAIVHQELSLAPELSVAENIFLGREPAGFMGNIRWTELFRQTRDLLDSLGLALDPARSAGSLGVGQQQMVEIAKALSHRAHILILDEPTAALTDAESEALFRILAALKSKGHSIIYISHRLEEVFRLADRITVMRDGRTVRSAATADWNENSVIGAMVGRDVSKLFPAGGRVAGSVALEVRNLEVSGSLHGGSKVTLKAYHGQVLGIAGLMGAGRTEMLATIFGASPWRGGEILVDGKPVTVRRPADAIAHGIAFVTEDRKSSGLLLEQSIVRNVTLPSLRRLSGRVFTDDARELRAAMPLYQSMRVKAPSPLVTAATLSGGNQQKVVLCKWLLTGPGILLLDEPTRGIDVGARQEIYAEIDKLARAGMAIVMVSSDLAEVLGMADRVLVMRDGGLAGEFTGSHANAHDVMACATGISRLQPPEPPGREAQ